jgi:hypothetical protein
VERLRRDLLDRRFRHLLELLLHLLVALLLLLRLAELLEQLLERLLLAELLELRHQADAGPSGGLLAEPLLLERLLLLLAERLLLVRLLVRLLLLW